ncbi:MAG: phosphoglycerate dehydrogenase, partial [Bacteroidia bacterium]|nr:phosphoglycerate dehydrogenase [Bacteroidia bacterium]
MLPENPLNILIVDDFHPSLKEGLETAGHIVTYLPEINSSEVKNHLENCQILIVRSKINIDASILESAPNLLIIGRG